MSRNRVLTGGVWLVVLLFFSAESLAADPAGAAGSHIERLERQLEMGRHELLAAVKSRPQSVLAPFTTDGCSGGLSVGWEYLAAKIKNFHTRLGEHPPWESCCVTHDRVYHSGGGRQITPEQSFAARRNADLELQACVRETGKKRIPALSAEYNLSPGEVKTLYTAIAALMYRSVRIGGMPCTGLPWRWGYGWPDCE